MRAISATESPWVYILSQFTPEAIYLEILAIALLVGCYTLYWLLRRRRLGLNTEVLPATLVRSHLNELIADSEALRAHLFGLMGQEGAPATGQLPTHVTYAPSANMNSTINADPALLQKIAGMESKISEQTKEIEKLLLEKTRIEEQLVLLKGQAGASGAPAGDNKDLLEKIRALEARLSEYSVIEDDLANLKRLQQENQQLKSRLGESGAAPTSVPAAVTETTATAAAAISAVASTLPSANAQTVTPEAPAPEPSLSAPTGNPAASKTESDAALSKEFEGLVDQVEASLAPAPSATTPSAAPAEPSAPAPEAGPTAEAAAPTAPNPQQAQPPAAATSTPEPATQASAPPAPATEAAPSSAPAGASKSDQDLLSEFEKLLGG